MTGQIRCDINQDNFVNADDFASFSNYWNPDPWPPEQLHGCWMFDTHQGFNET
jgi:hypothetical protein